MVDAILETADGMFRSGILDEETYDKIKSRHLPDGERAIEIPVPTGEDIRSMREKANLSQAVFARKLHLSASYVSQLERGVRQASGPTLVLLNLIRKRGIEAIQ
jgi:putative transcriptional regulator